MKKLLLAFAFLGMMVSCGQEKKEIESAVAQQTAEKIQWKTMNEALEAQKKDPKKILVFFHAVWCPYCHRMDETYSNKEIAKYINENYHAVKFDVEGNEPVVFQGKSYSNPEYTPNKPEGTKGPYHEFMRAMNMNIKGFPTNIIFDESANPIASFGYSSPRSVEPYLAMYATDDYKKITTQEQWEEYLKNFSYKNQE